MDLSVYIKTPTAQPSCKYPKWDIFPFLVTQDGLDTPESCVPHLGNLSSWTRVSTSIFFTLLFLYLSSWSYFRKLELPDKVILAYFFYILFLYLSLNRRLFA